MSETVSNSTYKGQPPLFVPLPLGESSVWIFVKQAVEWPLNVKNWWTNDTYVGKGAVVGGLAASYFMWGNPAELEPMQMVYSYLTCGAVMSGAAAIGRIPVQYM